MIPRFRASQTLIGLVFHQGIMGTIFHLPMRSPLAGHQAFAFRCVTPPLSAHAQRLAIMAQGRNFGGDLISASALQDQAGLGHSGSTRTLIPNLHRDPARRYPGWRSDSEGPAAGGEPQAYQPDRFPAGHSLSLAAQAYCQQKPLPLAILHDLSPRKPARLMWIVGQFLWIVTKS